MVLLNGHAFRSISYHGAFNCHDITLVRKYRIFSHQS